MPYLSDISIISPKKSKKIAKLKLTEIIISIKNIYIYVYTVMNIIIFKKLRAKKIAKINLMFPCSNFYR